jgi:hypothetical protein
MMFHKEHPFNSRRICSGDPGIFLGILSDADQCTTYGCSSYAGQPTPGLSERTPENPLQRKGNLDSQIHPPFHVKSSFCSLFLFSDKKLVAYPGNVLGQSIYKYKRLYYLPFPNVTVT